MADVPDSAKSDSIYDISRNSLPFSWEERAAVSELDVEAALGASVPGGSSVLAWLPMVDGHTIHQTARDVMRAAIAAVDKARSTRAAPPAMDREAVEKDDPFSDGRWVYRALQPEFDKLSNGKPSEASAYRSTAMLHAAGVIADAYRAHLSTLSADAIRQGEGFLRMVSRLTHSGDDGWSPDDADDATQTLDGLIAKARTTISGHTVDCAWHVDQYPHECTCAPATPASHASDGGKA